MRVIPPSSGDGNVSRQRETVNIGHCVHVPLSHYKMAKMRVMRLADYGLQKGAEKYAENPAGKGGRAVDICYNEIIK